MAPSRLAAWGIAGLLASACPRPAPIPRSPSPEPTETQRLADELAASVQAVVTAQDEAIWRHWTDGVALDLAKPWANRGALLEPATLQLLAKARAESTGPEDAEALDRLRVFLAGEAVAREVFDASAALTNVEASASFVVDSREHFYRDLPRLLAAEPSAPRRRALHAAAAPAVERVGQHVERRQRQLGEAVLRLGYPSVIAFAEALRDADLDQTAALAEQTLELTREPYLGAMDRLARRELGLPWAEVRRADLPRLFQGNGLEASFPSSSLFPRAMTTLQAMGIEPPLGHGVSLNLAPKRPFPPLTVALRSPGDVRLAFRPAGGVRDQAAFFHQLGLVLFHHHAKPRRFELNRLGTGTLAAGYAVLFERLTDDPEWLREHGQLSGEQLQQHLSFVQAERLFTLRRTAARVLFELAVQHPDANARQLYHEHFERALGLPHAAEDDARFSVERDELLQAADELRARALAGQLREELVRRFGERWWASVAAGAWLRELWAEGNLPSPDDLARRLGKERVKPDALARSLGARPSARTDGSSQADGGAPTGPADAGASL